MNKKAKKKRWPREVVPPNESEMTVARMAVVASSMAFGVEAEDIVAKRRGNEKVYMARMSCYWMLRKHEMLPYMRIGAALGKDHGSCMNGCRRIENELDLNLRDGYVPCIRDAEKYYKEFRSAHVRREVERKREEFLKVDAPILGGAAK